MSLQQPLAACTAAACRLAPFPWAGLHAARLLSEFQGLKTDILPACLPACPTLCLPCRFGWISFFLWIGSTIISYQEWRGSSVAGPAPQAPVIPNSSVGMV